METIVETFLFLFLFYYECKSQEKIMKITKINDIEVHKEILLLLLGSGLKVVRLTVKTCAGFC